MKFVLLNQAFHPDHVATSQYLTDVALALVGRGHEVKVLTSRRAYDCPTTTYPARETWRGIEIIRIWSTRFGKQAKWGRVLDFASFITACAWRLVFLPRQDVVVALTSPPLISFPAACFSKARRSRLVYWVMDLNPDEAIAAAWLRSGSFVARVLERMSRFSLYQASKVIVLDHFMRDRIVAKGIPAEKVEILPLWSQGIRFDGAGRDCFRTASGLEGKFVVMYSGNHSPCHPLSTLVDAARALEVDRGIVFCFVGGGSEFPKVQRSAEGLKNVLCVGYQPRAQLAAMLSAADLLVATMGTPFVGIVHPCKIYNMLSVGTPILYLGPRPSHITELLESESQVTRDWAYNAPWFSCAEHGQTDLVVKEILLARAARKNLTPNHEQPGAVNFSSDRILPKLIDQFESAADLERPTRGTGSVVSRECHGQQRLERRANVSP